MAKSPISVKASLLASIFGALLLFPRAIRAQCSDTDTSIQAVEQCVNAVRENPAYWNQFASCDISRYPPAPPLSPDGALNEAAQVHANNMASWGSINHNGFSSRVRGAGYNGPSIAENVAMGYRSALDVVMGWMCSSGHARNLMDCGMESMGTGVNCDPGQCFYAQTYGGSGSCGVPYGGSPTPGSGSSGSGGQQPTSYAPSFGRRGGLFGSGGLFGTGQSIISNILGMFFG